MAACLYVHHLGAGATEASRRHKITLGRELKMVVSCWTKLGSSVAFLCKFAHTVNIHIQTRGKLGCPSDPGSAQRQGRLCHSPGSQQSIGLDMDASMLTIHIPKSFTYSLHVFFFKASLHSLYPFEADEFMLL